ncbi:MAG: hypothetical protein IPG45_32125 [Deltaproteobacteria bacterium]|nr:hypothetical protein [Deltaproteobacteria bacterium]
MITPNFQRWGGRVLWGIGILYGLYFLPLNFLLLSKILVGWINGAQKNIDIEYDWALSFFPGHLMLRGVSLRVQDSAVEFQLDVDALRTFIDLGALLDQTFEAHGGDVEGATLHLRMSRPLAELCALEGGPRPPIRGLTLPLSLTASVAACNAQVETVQLPSGESPKEDLWRLRLVKIPAHLQEIWMEGLRLRGQVDANVSLYLWPTTELGIEASTLEVHTATLSTDRPLATNLSASAQIQLGVVQLDRDEVQRILGTLNAQLTLSAQIESFALLDGYLSGAEWVRFGQSHGQIKAEVRVDRGALLTGTHVVLEPATVRINAAKHYFSGQGRIRWEVSDEGSSRRGRLDVGLARFEVDRGPRSPTLARGRNLGFTLVGNDPTLLAPLSDLDVKAELESLTIPSAAHLNHYLPSDLGLRFLTGSATVSGALVVRHGHEVEEGRVSLLTDQLHLRYQDLEVSGQAELQVEITEADLEAGNFDLGGTTLRLRQVYQGKVGPGASASPPWWANLQLVQGGLRGSQLSMNLRLHLQNLLPVFSIYGADGRLPGPIRSYDPGEARGTLELKVGPEKLQLDRLMLDAGALNVQANLYQKKGQQSGGLLIGLHGLRVGLEIEAGGSQLVLFDPTALYQKRAQQRRAQAKEAK